MACKGFRSCWSFYIRAKVQHIEYYKWTYQPKSWALGLTWQFLAFEYLCKGNFGYCQNVPNMSIDHRLPLKLLWAILLNIYFRRRWCFQHQRQWKQNITFEVSMFTYQRKAVIFRSYHMQQMIHMYSLWHMYLGANNSVLQICMLSDLCRNWMPIVLLVAFALVLEYRYFSL